MKRLVIDYTKCTGCRYCELSCSAKKEGVYNPLKARIKTFRYGLPEQTAVTVCRHCERPLCMESCPVGALITNSATGVVELEESLCIGCGLCIESCPVEGAIVMHPEKEVPLKCNLCGGEPECIKFCVTKAITLSEEKETSPNVVKIKDALFKAIEQKGLSHKDFLISGQFDGQ